MKPPTPPPQFMCTPKRLGRADDDVGAVVGRRRRARRARSDRRRRSSRAPCRAGERARSRRPGLDEAEIGRGLEIDRGGLSARACAARSARSSRPVVGSASTRTTSMWPGHLDAARSSSRSPTGARGRRCAATSTSLPAGQARGHADGVADGAAPGIDRQADHLHVEQLAELAGDTRTRPGCGRDRIAASPRPGSGTRCARRSRRPPPARDAASSRRRGSSGSSSQFSLLLQQCRSDGGAASASE